MGGRPLALVGIALLAVGAAAWWAFGREPDAGARAERGPAPAPDPVVPFATLARAQPEAPAEVPRVSGPRRVEVRLVPAGAVAPDAVVRLRAGDALRTGSVDAAGTATFEGVPAGAVRAEVEAAGIATVWHDLTTFGDDSVALRLVPGVVLEGRLLDAADGTGLARAEVRTRTSPRDGGAITAADGSFRVSVAADAMVLVEVTAPGYETLFATVRTSARSAEPAFLERRLERRGRLRGVVRDRRGAPVADAAIEHWRAGEAPTAWTPSGAWSPRVSAKSDAAGRFAVEGLVTDVAYLVRARGTSAVSPAVTSFRVSDKGPREVVLDLVVSEPAALRVRVLDPAGAPVLDAHVYAGAEPDVQEKAFASDGDWYFFPERWPGDTPIEVRSRDHRRATGSAVLSSGVTSEVTIRLEAADEIGGTVVDETGAPVRGATVEAAPASDPAHEPHRDSWTRVHTDGEGRFRLVPPFGGRATLRASLAETMPRRDGEHGGRVSRRTETPVAVDVPADGVRLTLVRLGSLKFGLAPIREREGQTFRVRLTVPDVPGPVWEEFVDGAPALPIEIHGLEPLEYALEVATEGRLPLRRTVSVGLRQDVDLGALVLDPGVALRGRVTDEAGRPVSSAHVVVERDPADAAFGTVSTVSAADGAFVLGGLPATVQEGYVRAREHAETRFRADPRSGAATIVLTKGGLVRGVCSYPDGARAGSRRLDFEELGVAAPVTFYLETRADGTFEARLRAGRHRVTTRTRADHVLEDVGTVEAIGGETTSATLTLPLR